MIVTEILHDVACPNPGCDQHDIAKPLPAEQTPEGLLLSPIARCGTCQTPAQPHRPDACC